MMKFSMSRKIVIFSVVMVMLFLLSPISYGAPSLSEFGHSGASVLPYTVDPSGNEFYVLSEESGGRDAGTWDDFGGKTDPGENHPVDTASREFSEETMGFLGCYAMKPYVQKHTKHIIAVDRKKMVTYIVPIPWEEAEHFSSSFDRRRVHLRSGVPGISSHFLEKRGVGLIEASELKRVVSVAPRNAAGSLIVPIHANIQKIDAAGSRTTVSVPLRPVVVSKLQKFFQGAKYTIGRDSRARFYY